MMSGQNLSWDMVPVSPGHPTAMTKPKMAEKSIFSLLWLVLWATSLFHLSQKSRGATHIPTETLPGSGLVPQWVQDTKSLSGPLPTLPANGRLHAGQKLDFTRKWLLSKLYSAHWRLGDQSHTLKPLGVGLGQGWSPGPTGKAEGPRTGILFWALRMF
jgi:hypothetical protein